MQYFNKLKARSLLLALVIITGGMQSAHAAGTAAGTPVNNTATVDYQLSGANQPQVSSNIETFVVDNRISLTVTNTGGANIVPGETGQAVSFTVTNTGNKAQGYSLTAGNLGADNFDMSNFSIYIEDGTTVGFQSGEDTAYTLGNNAFDLNPDQTSVVVYVVSDAPGTPTNTQTADVYLMATTLNAGLTTTPTVLGSGDANTANEDNVYGDSSGPAAADNNYDGNISASGTYTIAVTPLTLTKSHAVYSDPINSTTNPKAIPGATIRYTLVVNNGGSTDATNVVINDVLPGGITYTTNSVYVDFGGGAVGPYTDGNADGVAAFAGSTLTVDVSAAATAQSIAGAPALTAGSSATITFDVTID